MGRKLRKSKFYPPYRVDTWFERDRAFVGVYDGKDRLVAEWWDDEVKDMFDSGSFKSGRKFESSVLRYLADVGAIDFNDI